MLEQTIAFLRQDRLRNVVPLKMLAAHAERIQIHFCRQANQIGVLLLFPTDTFAYDRQSYAAYDRIAIAVASHPAAVALMLPHLPRQESIVFKLADPQVHKALATQLPLTRVTGFISYTSSPDTYAAWTDTVIANEETLTETMTPDARLYPLFAAQGHEPDDLDHYFREGVGRVFTRYVDEEPVAACFTYQNFEQIHEIGGVFTLPTERRKGYAKQVVSAALASLHARSLVPRYQVHEANRASIRLAEAIGLTPFVLTEHWAYRPAGKQVS